MFLLDATVIVRVQQAGLLDALVSAAARTPWIVAEQVWAELTDPENPKPKAAEAARQAKAIMDGRVEVRKIETGSPTERTLRFLRRKKKTANDRGEADSIALVAHDPSLRLVTDDARAAFTALGEIRERERVWTGPLFIRHLVDERLLAVAAARSIGERWPQLPSWWDVWVDECTAREAARTASPAVDPSQPSLARGVPGPPA
jgi:predicted nucleic acid-binding protein